MLSIVGTPLGNAKDISLRSLETLIKADVILVEDTRHFIPFYKKAQELLDMSAKDDQKIVPYHDQNEFKQLPYVLKMLDDHEIALVSDAGMPTFSDPGQQLIEKARKRNIEVQAIPGPTAFSTALALSGFQYDQALFLGFLAKKKSHIEKKLKNVIAYAATEKHTAIGFYESPHRMLETLQLLDVLMPDADICIARELTKKYEECIFGHPYQLLDRDYKGELTVIVKIPQV